MSSINSVFQPMTPTYAVDNSAAVQIKEAVQAGASVFRIRALKASGYIKWGRANTIAAPTTPALGTPQSNMLGVTFNAQPVYLELPADSFFIGDAAIATSNFEITAGQGGASSG